MKVQFITPNGGYDGYGTSSEYLKSYLSQNGIQLTKESQDVALCYNYPTVLKDRSAKHIVIFTMFESTELPKDWIQYLEKADQIVVPSGFLQEVFLLVKISLL